MTPTQKTLEVIYTWPNGRQEIRYSPPAGTITAARLVAEVRRLQQRAERGGRPCPYSFRLVEANRT